MKKRSMQNKKILSRVIRYFQAAVGVSAKVKLRNGDFKFQKYLRWFSFPEVQNFPAYML